MNTRGNEPNIMAEAVGLFRSTQRPPFIATVKEATITKKKKTNGKSNLSLLFLSFDGGSVDWSVQWSVDQVRGGRWTGDQ